MSVDLFTTVRLFRTQLTVARHLLDKGAEYARANAIDEAALLDWRLIDDMQPLRFQLGVVINFAQGWPARVAGLPLPADVALDADGDTLRAALDRATAFLGDLTVDRFTGRDDVPITFQIGTAMEPTMPAGRWLTGFAATNLHFHLSIAYAILRAKGVPLGKLDLFAAGL